MNMYEILGIAAGVFSLLGYIPYIFSTIRGSTRPNKATWIIWAVVGGLIAFSYMAEGDPNTIWLPLGYFIGPLIIAILSFWRGVSIWTKLDVVCLVIAGISIIPWLLLKDGTTTLFINVLIDATGAIPTLVKAYHEPETEDFTAWTIFLMGNTLQVFAISYWNIAAIYPIYLVMLAGAMVAFILKGKIKRRTAPANE